MSRMGLWSRRTWLLVASSVLLYAAFADTPQVALPAFPGGNGEIAFVSHRDGNAEIYVMADGGLNQTRLTNDLGADEQPAWSPDGTKIVWARTTQSNFQGIWVMNADGSGQTMLTSGASGADYNPGWSPDGQKIVFASIRDNINGDIYVMDANGQNPTRLTTTGGNSRPAWSPDGTKIVFETNGEVFVMNANGTGQTNLSNDPGHFDGEAAWSPDGTRIAFMSRRAGPDQIYVMQANGSNPVNVSNDLNVDDDDPAWSPDGTRIAFTSDRGGGQNDVWAMTSTGASPAALTTAVQADADPDWQPVPPARITVKKALRPVTDSGRFDLRVDATVVRASAGNGGSGSATAAFGSHSVSEVAATGTDLANYASSVVCTRNGQTDVSGPGTSINVSVITGDIEVCTFTNKRKATITLRKALAPTTDAGRFNLLIGSTVVAPAVGDGGSGGGSFAPVSYRLKETASSGLLANYTSSFACTLNGSPGPSGTGTGVTIAVAPAANVDCTFTNVRKPKLTLKKVLRPLADPGRFDLLVNSTVVRAAAGDGDSGHVLLLPGSYTVSEVAAVGILTDYTSRITCTKNGAADISGTATSLGVTLAAGDVELCTFRNTHL